MVGECVIHLGGEMYCVRVKYLAQEDNTVTPTSFSNPPETFQTGKAIFSYLYLKTCIGLKLCVKGTSVPIKNTMELNSSVIIRLEILL